MPYPSWWTLGLAAAHQGMTGASRERRMTRWRRRKWQPSSWWRPSTTATPQTTQGTWWRLRKPQRRRGGVTKTLYKKNTQHLGKNTQEYRHVIADNAEHQVFRSSKRCTSTTSTWVEVKQQQLKQLEKPPAFLAAILPARQCQATHTHFHTFLCGSFSNRKMSVLRLFWFVKRHLSTWKPTIKS